MLLQQVFYADGEDLTLTSATQNIRIHAQGNTVNYDSYRINKGGKVFVIKNVNHYDLLPIYEYTGSPWQMPYGYEIQFVEGTFANSENQNIIIKVPNGKELLHTPTIEVMDKAGVRFVGKGYRVANDWAFSAYTKSDTRLELEGVKPYIQGEKYRMTLEFINN